ncbi:hypothetical protein [Roseivirga pacifica]|uniref:hypothetical protein n=1 Tax=Roseivirga pacifica TaxID=1267423 RepID=UPI00209492A8|nr:hypothetical protein [Roseivirga pacifica]MCO6360555.1 hypothetical protein [Roseivirga pacifica]MCO6368444.1 hypothetical protein [Roseivirga pacifica]MCO6372586.1 hypothetical protein [Roseivirga pacifica]MCO6376644.1 hypothetical protein [Roseivirga pacifica]MCO6378076.1 hypothetical protein [Roseivirga pacifica]
MKNLIIAVILIGLLTAFQTSKAQGVDSDTVINYTPFELLSSYYDNDFQPFKKRNVYVGFAFSLADRKQNNDQNLLSTVIDGERLDYDLLFKAGLYTADYGMVGVSVNYFQNRFDGLVFQDPDTVMTNTINRGFSITPNVRSSVPLTANERLSFFTEVGLTFGGGNSLSRKTKNVDEVEKIYDESFYFRLGMSPGITFFAMENFAFEVQMDVLGYELRRTKTTTNDVDVSKDLRQNVDFNINILTLELGLAYYFQGGFNKRRR